VAKVAATAETGADDRELVAAYRLGDVAAFEELYRRYYPMVLRRLTRMCGSEAIAEELAQETFLRAAQSIGSLSEDLRFRAWVMRVGANLGIDHLRALRRAPARSFEALLEVRPAAGADVEVDTEQRVVDREALRQVISVLDRLHPRHRQVLVLREIEGLDYRTIAERMQTSFSAVETLLFRARIRFREEYAKQLVA
jgi:RNA polymerase sigma-70 factor (ECF subfamily)